jgi:hypothetical protein
MKRIPTLWLVLMLASAGAVHAETRVFCPEGLKWSSEGECRVEFDRLPKPLCPRGSHLSQPSVTGPKYCVTGGGCPPNYKPDRGGICRSL